MSGRGIRILIVTNTRMYREGLAFALERRFGFEIAGAVADVGAALASLGDVASDIVLLDTGLPRAADAIRQIHAARPDARIVAVAMVDGDERAVSFAEAGVASYVSSDASLPELIDAIEAVARGEAVASPRITADLLRRVADVSANGAAAPELLRLTMREREILGLIQEGLSNKEIARQLVIEVATVKNHVHNILEKLHVRSRGEAAAHVRPLRR